MVGNFRRLDSEDFSLIYKVLYQTAYSVLYAIIGTVPKNENELLENVYEIGN